MKRFFALRNNNGKCQLGVVLGIFGHQFFTPKCLQENFCFFTSIFTPNLKILKTNCCKKQKFGVKKVDTLFQSTAKIVFTISSP